MSDLDVRRRETFYAQERSKKSRQCRAAKEEAHVDSKKKKAEIILHSEMGNKKMRGKFGLAGSSYVMSYSDNLASFSEYDFKHGLVILFAAAGFCFVVVEDTHCVHCNVCGLTLSEFDVQTYDPISLHQTFRPDCKFLSQYGPEAINRNEEMDTRCTHNQSIESASLMTIQEIRSEETSADAQPSSPSAENKISTYKTRLIERRTKVFSQLSREYKERFAHYMSDMYCEISRQESFSGQTLPIHLTANILATKGFYFGGRNEETSEIKCAFCNVTIPLSEDVNSMEAVDKSHYSLKPDCPFLTGKETQNIPDIYNNSLWSSSETEEINSPSALSDLGVNNSFAKHPLLAVPDIRISTYLTFPHTYRSNIDVDLLSEAGYFYEGDADSVTCFYCGCKSAKWGSGEDVWKRHARTSPSCQHVLSTKGASFVSGTLQELGEYQPSRARDLIQNVTTRIIRPRWDTPVIRRSMEIGIDRTHLKTVVINRIKRGERDFRYLAEVVQAVNDLKVPPSNLPKDNQTVDKLPEVVQLTHSYESDSEDDIGSVDETNLREGSSSNSVQADAAQEVPQVSSAELEPELNINVRDMITQLTCKICFSAVVGIIFLPCGHLVCCVSCAPAMVDCPICRKTINGTVQAFMP